MIIEIPICSFGKKLNIKEIIESVEYVKGDKNDIGDAKNDVVRISIREEGFPEIIPSPEINGVKFNLKYFVFPDPAETLKKDNKQETE